MPSRPFIYSLTATCQIIVVSAAVILLINNSEVLTCSKHEPRAENLKILSELEMKQAYLVSENLALLKINTYQLIFTLPGTSR